MTDDRLYVQVYYQIAREFPEVWRDDRLLATWLRLLMLANAVWPAAAVLPRNAAKKAVDSLENHGLIEREGDEFRVRGLDKQRQFRRDRAASAARTRWGEHSTSNAVAMHEHSPSNARPMPNRTEQKKIDTSEDDSSPSKKNDDNGVSGVEAIPERWTDLAALMESLTGKPYALRNPWAAMSVRALELVERHGWDAFEAMARKVAGRLGAHPGVDEIVFGVGDGLRRRVDTADVRKADRADDEAATARRRVAATQRNLHDLGSHHDGPALHPQCPLCAGVDTGGTVVSA
jgi:hypothetical protein